MSEEQKQGNQENQGKAEFTDQEIRGMKSEQRQQLCAVDVNAALRKWNCILNPVAHISNMGAVVEAKIVGCAYPVEMPEGMVQMVPIIPSNFN